MRGPSDSAGLPTPRLGGPSTPRPLPFSRRRASAAASSASPPAASSIEVERDRARAGLRRGELRFASASTGATALRVGPAPLPPGLGGALPTSRDAPLGRLRCAGRSTDSSVHSGHTHRPGRVSRETRSAAHLSEVWRAADRGRRRGSRDRRRRRRADRPARISCGPRFVFERTSSPPQRLLCQSSSRGC